MTNPKQIIYPLRYIRSLIREDRGSEAEFKTSFARLLGGDLFVIPLGRARGGIYILTKLTIKGTKRKVILSPYTIPDVVNMVRFAGGEPVFVDVLPNSTNIDVDHLSRLMDENTASVLLTHYHVNQNSMIEIRQMCVTHQAKLFDDCALALGADFMGTPIGRATDASIFSLSSFKALNFFWGGAITTTSRALAERLLEAVESWPRLRLSQYKSQILKTLRYDVATKQTLFSNVLFPILRKKITASEMQDVLPLSRVESRSLDETITSRPSFSATGEWNRKIATINKFLAHRRGIAAIYDQEFEARFVSRETSREVRQGSCYVNYPIFVDPGHRNDVYRDILARGFDVGLSLYPNAQETPGFAEIPGDTRNVSALVRSVITLPTHPGISETYAHELALAVRGALSKSGLG